MHFTETPIRDLWIVEPERIEDHRGSFARTFCVDDFARRGLPHRFVQHSVSLSTRKHTLRGLHFQAHPHQETKIVSCVRGAIWDVAVDLRPLSPTYLAWVSTVLSQENGAQFLIPEGFAHGFLSLTDDVAVTYMISTPYVAGSARGLRYDDPAIGIDWPAPPAVLSSRDLAWPLLEKAGLLQPDES
ncbi:dTDP-4-dehydrorhamnose 3,5-epimerase [Rhizobium sp. Leaf341]|uniref:dTDP-4-dehydrorhamnose 3,5-epimerase n=1 Tax=Rhizobium sp. Leaf341 TaxID=1736344 RepID=UPI000713E8DB|nr:dTDP-4-dehydrorhamnose 3,5-epimerase [Rhizobium sp. Leaf341]KQR76046.1 dTDP-4-dehydrorhamnose 3,5-epimerase [Rhizobium sp. Leaf341]